MFKINLVVVFFYLTFAVTNRKNMEWILIKDENPNKTQRVSTLLGWDNNTTCYLL